MEQNTPEWLEFRRNKIGASDCPAILGISPWTTPYQLWEEKVLGKRKESTDRMTRGQQLEPLALERFMEQTGTAMLPSVVVNPLLDWQMASFDGLSWDGKEFVEIKCPGKETHLWALRGEIPEYYKAQMQHQMCVLDVGYGYYFSFDGENGVVIKVERDDEFIRHLLEKEEEFLWHMKAKEPPELSPKDYTEHCDAPWANLAAEWKEVSAQIKILKEKEQDIRQNLIELCGERSGEGAGIRVKRTPCKGHVHYDQIPELIGVDLTPYRKPFFDRWTITNCK